jgi:putative transposase
LLPLNFTNRSFNQVDRIMRAQTQPYPGDLNDEQGELLASLIPLAKSGGRPRSVDMRTVSNALFYVLRTGCAWRWLPHDYPAWQTVYHYFRAWRKDGT